MFRLAGLVWLLTAACAFPRDGEGTAERVHHGELRAAFTRRPPDIECDASTPRGPAVDRIAALSRRLNTALIAWCAAEADIVRGLESFEVDLGVGFDADTPWKKRVGTTRPDDRNRVLLTPPGENAWLLELDRLQREAG